jgi:hypothetical protein
VRKKAMSTGALASFSRRASCIFKSDVCSDGEDDFTIVATLHSFATPDDLGRSLPPHTSFAIEAVGADFAAALTVVGTVKTACSTALWAAEHDAVLWVERRERVRFASMSLATHRASTRTNSRRSIAEENGVSGLHGEGQILGIGDTGIDHDNCFFRDDRFPVPMNSVNLQHRKIVAYWADSDDRDAIDGHGTFVAGLAVGQTVPAEMGIGRINGLASEAKVAFTDFDPASAPNVLDGQYFARPYSAGVRVHSDSWGTYGSSDYDSRSRSLDRFVRLHRDFLSVTAAGNFGPNEGTVAAPCVAKNTLCVGAFKRFSSLAARIHTDGLPRCEFHRHATQFYGAGNDSKGW